MRCWMQLQVAVKTSVQPIWTKGHNGGKSGYYYDFVIANFSLCFCNQGYETSQNEVSHVLSLVKSVPTLKLYGLR